MKKLSLVICISMVFMSLSCKERAKSEEIIKDKTENKKVYDDLKIDSNALAKSLAFNEKIDSIDENDPQDIQNALVYTDSTLYYLAKSNTTDSEFILKTMLESGGTYFQLNEGPRGTPFMDLLTELALKQSVINSRILITNYVFKARNHIDYNTDKDVYNNILKPWENTMDSIKELHPSTFDKRTLQDYKFLHRYWSYLIASQSGNSYLLIKTLPGFLESINNIEPSSALYEDRLFYYDQLANSYLNFDLDKYKSIYIRVNSGQKSMDDWFSAMKMKLYLHTVQSESDSVVYVYNKLKERYKQIKEPTVQQQHYLGILGFNYLAAINKQKADSTTFYTAYHFVKNHVDNLPQTQNMNPIIYLSSEGQYLLDKKKLSKAEVVLRKIKQLHDTKTPRSNEVYYPLDLTFKFRNNEPEKEIKRSVHNYLSKFKKKDGSLLSLDRKSTYGPQDLKIILKMNKIIEEYSNNPKKYNDLSVELLKVATQMQQNFSKEGILGGLTQNTLDDIESGLLQSGKIAIQDQVSFINTINALEGNKTLELNRKTLINNIQQNDSLLNFLFEEQKLSKLLKETTWNNSQIDSLYKAKANFRRELNLSFPAYAHFNNNNFDLATYQKSLIDNETVLRFYESKDLLLAVVITREAVKGTYFNKTDDYHNYLNDLTSNLHSRKLQMKNPKFEKFINELSLTDNYIAIVPSKTTSRIPFAYYMPSLNISYKNSLVHDSLFKEKQENLNGLISFSPGYETTSDAQIARTIERSNTSYNLPFAREESMFVSKLFRGTLLTDKRASKKQFLDKYYQYDVHHLAMHAVIEQGNDKAPTLIFSGNENNTLSTEDIQQLKFNSKLVTLSACNTAYGKADPIEGTMSLSRAFQYAGARATLTSLWRVPDRETSIIVKSFYTHLKNGERKDVALKMAQNDYLKNTVEADLKHPYYWAGFILTGDTNPIATATPWWIYSLFIAASLLIILWLSVLVKKKKRKAYE